MTIIVSLSSKGQLVLPAAIRARLGLGAGSRLAVVEEPDGIRLQVERPVEPRAVDACAGMLVAPRRGRPRSLDEFDAASTLRRGAK